MLRIFFVTVEIDDGFLGTSLGGINIKTLIDSWGVRCLIFFFYPRQRIETRRSRHIIQVVEVHLKIFTDADCINVSQIP